jgi:ABC-type branched-subunit amino acid transport system substrate-binding protein
MRRRWIFALAAVAMVGSACGTRLPDAAFVDQTQAVVAGGGGASTGGGGGGATDDGTTPGEAGPGAVDGSAPPLPDGSTPGGGPSGGPSTTAGPGGTSGGPGPATGVNQASDVGITPNTIALGTIVAENGVLGDAFAPAARGLRAWAQYVNAKGGINGRKIVLKTCDDGEDRNKALACAQRLVEQDKVFALVATNTRALGGAAQYLNDKGVPVIGIPITNSYARYPHLWSGYPNGYARDGQTVGYKGQIMFTSGIYRWFKTHLNTTKAAVFAYDIDESKQAGSAFAKGMELEGFAVTSYTVSFAAPSFDQAVADMQRNGVQIIVDAMDDGANRKLCDAMARRSYTVVAKVSTVVSFGDKVGSAYNDTCRNNVYIPGETIPYSDTSIPAVAEFRSAFAKYQPGKDVHEWALEAWFQATVVGDGIKKMGTSPTRKGLEDHFRSLDRYSGGGVSVGLDWRPIDYAKPTNEDCFTIARWQDSQKGWVRATETFPFCYADAKQYGAAALEQGN